MKVCIETVYVESMLARTMDNRQLAMTLFEKLFLELPEQLLTIEKFIKLENFALAENMAHKLHGSLSFCGFLELKVLAGNLENSLSVKHSQNALLSLSLLREKILVLIDSQEEIFKCLAVK